MIKFYKQNQWKSEGDVVSISLLNVSVVHCKCGCGEWSIFVIVLGFGGIATYNKNYGK